MKKSGAIFLIVFFAAGSAGAAVDIMFIVDESGSMYGEHEWIGNMVTYLDSELVNAGQIDNLYSLIGYGAGSSYGGPDARRHLVGCGDWGTAAQLSTATGQLETSGSIEDGWEAIDFGLRNYSFHDDSIINMILITDEGRDVLDSKLTYDKMLTKLTAKNVMLNVVVDCGFQDSLGESALGVDADGYAYVADGFGGYIASPGCKIVSPYSNTGSCYVQLAWATGGAAWDLNQLRIDGLLAESFTTAFVDIKVSEIACVPAPGAFLLGSIGIVVIDWLRKRKII